MTRAEITTKLRALVEHASPRSGPLGDLTEETAFADLRFDSLAMLELVYDVEEQFHLAIPETELVSLKTVGQLVDLIEQKTAAG